LLSIVIARNCKNCQEGNKWYDNFTGHVLLQATVYGLAMAGNSRHKCSVLY
jgi:hypothetical protein